MRPIFISLLLATACNPETGIKAYNASPKAQIGSNVDGDEVEAGAPLTFWGSASDPDSTPDLLLATWYSGSTELCAAATPDDDGRTTCEATLPEGETTIILEVRDPGEATDTDRVEISATTEPVLNTAPSCAITAPADGEQHVPGEAVSFTGYVADAESAPEALTVMWSSDLDGALDNAGADVHGLLGFSAADLSLGAHVISLVVSDPDGALCSDAVSVIVGDAPLVSIEAPTDGERLQEGEGVLFSGLVSSSVDAATDLSLVWESDLDGELSTETADSAGVSTFTLDDLSPGTHELTLTATDTLGSWGEDTITFVVNGKPSAPSISITPGSPGSTDDLSVTIDTASVDPEGGTVSYIYEWTLDGEVTAFTGATIDADQTENDQVWTVTVTPWDGEIEGPSDSASVTIGNSAPELSSVTLSPEPAYEGDTLTCTPATGTDADGDAVSYTYAWTVDGAALARSSSTLSSSYFSKGDAVFCTVTPNDGRADGDPVDSNTVTIQNTAPVASAVAISPTDPSVGDTLTCGYTFSDADGDSDASTVRWTINGAAAGSGTTLSTAFAGDDTITCTVTPFDGTDSGSNVSASVTIGNTAPELASVTLTPTTAYEGDTLTCTPGTATDADGDTVSYSYAWTVNGSAISRTSSTLSSTYFDRDDAVYCLVTPTDGSSTGTAVKSNTVTISNTAPEASGVSISPSSPTASDRLTCSYTFSDADSDSDASTVAWKVNGTSAGTGTTLSSGYKGGDSVTCTVTPNDGTDAGTAVSKSVTVANTAPTLASVTLTPTTAYEGDTLTCTPGTSSDPDGDSVSYTYGWKVAGSTISRTSSTLSSTYFSKGQAVVCTVTPSDGTASGAAVTSNTVTIENSAPEVSAVTITPASPTASDTLTCSYTFSDGDSDTDHSTIAWKINGTSAGSGTTLSSGYSGGDTVSCTVTPNDGEDSGTAVSKSVTVSNSAPSLASVTLSPDPAYEGDTLTCTPGTATDPDGDTVSYTYSWTVDGASPGRTTSTLSSTYFSKGNSVRCSVTPTDGSTSGTAVASNIVAIANSKPVLSSVTLSPSAPTTNSTLSVSLSSSDADGDTVSYTYSWTVNGTVVSTGSTLSGATYFSHGDTVAVTVTPTDGTASGTAVSASVTIGNTAPEAPTVATTPEILDGGDDELLCYVVTDSADADGDAITYTVSWEVDGLPYPAGFTGTVGPETTEWTDDTVPAADTDLGEVWTCTVTPDDGSTEGAVATAEAMAYDFYSVGWYTGSSGPGLVGASYLLGPSVTVSSDTTLYQVGAWLNTAGNSVRMAVYTSSGGVPGTLVAYTAVETTALGNNVFDVVTPAALPAGTYYVMAVYNASTYAYYGSTTTGTVKYKSASYSSTPSSSFGTASSYTGYPLAYYMVVAD